MDIEPAIIQEGQDTKEPLSFESQVDGFGPEQVTRESLWRRTRYAELVTGKSQPAHENEKQELTEAIGLLRRRNKELTHDREAPDLDSVGGRLQAIDAKLSALEERTDEAALCQRRGLEIRQGLLFERQRELRVAAGVPGVDTGAEQAPADIIAIGSKTSEKADVVIPLVSTPSKPEPEVHAAPSSTESVRESTVDNAVEVTQRVPLIPAESTPSQPRFPVRPTRATNAERQLQRPVNSSPVETSAFIPQQEPLSSTDAKLDNSSTLLNAINKDLHTERGDSHAFMVDAGVFSDFIGEQTRQAYENAEPDKLLGGRIYTQEGGDGLSIRISKNKVIVRGTYYYRTKNKEGKEIFENAHITRAVFQITPEGKLVPAGRSIVRNDWGVVTMRKETPFDPNAFGDNLATFMDQRIDPQWNVSGFEIIDDKLGIRTERNLDAPTIPIPKVRYRPLMSPHREEEDKQQEFLPIEQGQYVDKDGNEWILEAIKEVNIGGLRRKKRNKTPVEVRLRKTGESNRLKAIKMVDYQDFLREINRPNGNGAYTYIVPEEPPSEPSRMSSIIDDESSDRVTPVPPPPPEKVPTGDLMPSEKHEEVAALSPVAEKETGPVIEVTSTDDVPKTVSEVLNKQTTEACTLSLDTKTLEKFLVNETKISEEKEPNLLGQVISFEDCNIGIEGDTLRVSGNFSLNATVKMHIENAAFQVNAQGDLVLINDATIQETGRLYTDDFVDSGRSQQMHIQAEYIFNTFGNSLASLLTKGMKDEGSQWKAKGFSLLNGRLGIHADKSSNPLQQSFDDGVRRSVAPRKQEAIGTQASIAPENVTPKQSPEATGAMLPPLKLEGAFSELQFPDSFSTDMKETLRRERSDKHVFFVKPETLAEFLVMRTQRAMETKNSKELLGEGIAFNHLAMKIDAGKLLMNGTFNTGDKESEMLLETTEFDISPDGRIESITTPTIKPSESLDAKVQQTSKIIPEMRFKYFGESLSDYFNTLLSDEKWGVKGFQVVNDELAMQMQKQ